MTASLWIPGPMPNLNDIIDANKAGYVRGRGYTVMKSQWTNLVAMLAKRAHVPAFKRARFTFVWREKDKRRNPDNIAAAHKFVLDGLVMAKVLVNDGWAEVAGWLDEFEVGSPPGVLVLISEAE